MGFFKSIFAKDHRAEALEIKDYILSLDLSKVDQDLIQVLGVESHRYTFQRSCLRLGVAAQVFEIVDGKLNTDVVSAAHGFFGRIMMEYIDNLRVMNAMDAYSELGNAKNIYFALDPTAKVAAIFLAKLTDNKMGANDLNTLPQLLDMVNVNLKCTVALVKDKLMQLR